MERVSSPAELAAAFDSLVPGRATWIRTFLDGLGVFDRDGPFHPTEFSLSLAPNRAPRWRAMSQLRSAGGFPAREVVDRATNAVRRFAPRAPLALLVRLLQTVYPESPVRRFGLGLELQEDGVRGLRAYLDLFAEGPDAAGRLRREALALVGFGDPVPEIPVRILGVDLGADGRHAARLYFAADRVMAAPSSALCGVALPGGSRKLDLYLPDLYASDQAASLALESLLEDLAIEATPFRSARELMLDGVPPCRSRNVLQYLSLDEARATLGVYFRPRSFGVDWLPARGRPGLGLTPAPAAAAPALAAAAPTRA